MTRSRMQFTALVAAAAVLLAALLWSSRDEAEAAHAVPDPARAAVAARPLPPSATLAAPLPEGDFSGIRDELERRAGGGDAEAAYRLGHLMAVCRTYRPAGEEMLADILVSGADMLRGMLRIAGDPVDEQALLEMVVHGKVVLDRTCAGATGLHATTGPGEAHRWMQRAAALGHPQAKAEYATVAFAEYTTDGALLDNAAEVARRRERARRLLDEALASGEPTALAAAARWHGAGGPGPRDPVRALAYWLAWRSTDEAGETPDVALQLGDKVYRRALSPEDMRRAEQAAADITAPGRRAAPP